MRSRSRSSSFRLFFPPFTVTARSIDGKKSFWMTRLRENFFTPPLTHFLREKSCFPLLDIRARPWDFLPWIDITQVFARKSGDTIRKQHFCFLYGNKSCCISPLYLAPCMAISVQMSNALFSDQRKGNPARLRELRFFFSFLLVLSWRTTA